MKTVYTILLLVFLSACAPKQNDTQASPGQAPEPLPQAPQAIEKVYCGDTLIETQGYVLKVNLATTEVTLLEDGIYGTDEVKNNWGMVVTPACHYMVLNGTVSQ